MRISNIFKLFFLRIISFFKNFNILNFFSRLFSFAKRPLLPFILYKMLTRSFIYWWSIAQSLFIVIFLIFDFFSKIDKYISSQISTLNILIITGLLVPKALWLSMPIAIMFGITMSIASFYQDNELIAVFTSGISIYKFVVPLIIICFSLSIVMIFFDSYVVIPTFRIRENLFEQLTNVKDDERNMTIKDQKGNFWNIQKYEENKNMLKNIMVIKYNEDFRVIYRVDAASAVYTKDGWLFRNGIIRKWDKDGELESETKIYKKVLDNLTEPPKTFRSIFRKSDYDIEKMTILEARDRLTVLRNLNIFHYEELRDYYKKFSFPFTLLIVCLFAIGVSTLSQKNILILSLFFSIGISILYYIAQMILDVLCASGKLHPLITAWAGIIIFIPVSIYLIKKAKT